MGPASNEGQFFQLIVPLTMRGGSLTHLRLQGEV